MEPMFRPKAKRVDTLHSGSVFPGRDLEVPRSMIDDETAYQASLVDYPSSKTDEIGEDDNQMLDGRNITARAGKFLINLDEKRRNRFTNQDRSI